ncbi:MULTISPECIES: Crp/Fnr family transcriptional regulator [Psychrilyobacter]|uniref:Crp/Fnr family transcriptional regulator n=1 Tax=Psychrilyobacter piezotolerans TaxID=2293438 RepID=A0ABX9KI02_9FUSO|nr:MULTISPECIES: Crp/Fnr family transcriptional regulator [Psychrilyobacter]MCS5422979.1 Crp/Fnr family transcriptional regulator [Psychrilyobacter sp. S5]NDI77502.1 Crp/Fnr family transcriptional regulator [Psychrilyobacter piezotolerans]RDE62985.1 Crp/Fnr family transcriptional regulator [Psychrilyobacter sp. S5]REI41743.1 Crp/Fnr family transcriptional regulator [Psychrilyobacter piezotolerans]
MTKAEILSKLNLEELIGTPFENMIDITKIKRGSSVYYERLKEFNTCYIIEGHIQHIVYTPDGGEFYRDLYEDEITGVNFCFSKKISQERFRLFDVDIVAKEDSKIAYLPLDKIMDLEFKGKSAVLKKLIMMGVEDHFKEFKYLLLKNVYSDEQFFIKHLEKCQTIDIGSTRIISEHLNINLRTLQRLLKNLQDQGIIERTGDKLSIKDPVKLGKYKEKFEK